MRDTRELVERLRVKGALFGEQRNHTYRRHSIERAEAADALTSLAERNEKLEADNERLRNNHNRFPDLTARIAAVKTAPLDDRISAILAAVAAMPSDFGRYQWEASKLNLFGDKWVHVVGNDGEGMGRQAIAAIPGHLTGVPEYIAAANPDSVLMLIANLQEARAAIQKDQDQ